MRATRMIDIQRCRVAIAGIAALLLPLLLQADAIVRSQAMFAETIAEIYVSDDGVVVDLEIGMDDIAPADSVPPFRHDHQCRQSFDLG